MSEPHIPQSELEEELGRVVARGRRRKTQRTSALAGALAVVVVVAAVGFLRTDPDDSSVRVADQGTTTSTVADDGPVVTDPTTPTTSGPAPTAPDRMKAPRPTLAVVVVESQRVHEGTPVDENELVVVDASSGKRQRTIYRTGAGIFGVQLSPDRKHVYFTTESCGFGVVERVRVDGAADQQPEQVTKLASSEPALTPDGKQLAYVGHQGCEEDVKTRSGIRVRDLATGAERFVAAVPEGYQMRSLTWSADGKQLALAIDRFTEGDPGSNVRSESFVVFLDPSKEQDALKAGRLTSKRQGFGFLDPTFLPDGSLFVVETPLGGRKDPALLLVVNASSGATLRRVATGDPARTYGHTSADATGNHLMYISFPDLDGRRTGELRVSSNGERTTVLVNDVVSADW